MNKIKIDNYYKPESKTLRLDEVDYTIIPNSDIKPLLDKLQQENKQLKDNWNKLKNCMIDIFNRTQEIYYLDLLETMQELEQGSDNNDSN